MKRPYYKYLKCPYTKAWLHHLYLMAHEYQFGVIKIITGGTRMGKSMSAITLADLLSLREFTERNIGFTPKEYIQTLADCKTGDVLVWSELGVAMPARKWFSLSNLLLADVIQTMMIKKPIIIMDVPDLSFVDVQARKMIYYFGEAVRWETHPVQLWIYNVEINRKTGEIYFPHPVFNINGQKCAIQYIRFDVKPPKDIWEIYDKKQREYKDKIRLRSLKLAEELEKNIGEKSAEKTIYDYINIISANKSEFSNSKGKLDTILIKYKLNVDTSTAREIKKVFDYIEQKKLECKILS